MRIDLTRLPALTVLAFAAPALAVLAIAAASQAPAAGQTAPDSNPAAPGEFHGPALRGTMVVAGERYAPGTRVALPLFGLSVVVPEEWTGLWPPGTDVFLLGSETRAGLGGATAHGETTLAALAAALDEAQDLGEGIVLEPAAPPVTEGAEVHARYTGGQGLVGLGRAIRAPLGHAVTFFFAGPASEESYYEGLLTALARSCEFAPPDVSALVGEWQALLAGMKLEQLESYSSYGGAGAGGGTSRHAVWHLCADGRFTSSYSAHTAIDAEAASGLGTTAEERSGRWSVAVREGQAILVLAGSDGAETTHALASEGEKTFLDGERVFRVPSDACP